MNYTSVTNLMGEEKKKKKENVLMGQNRMQTNIFMRPTFWKQNYN